MSQICDKKYFEKLLSQVLENSTFSPIVIFSADNPKFILKENNDDDEPYQLMPAFVLYANDEKAFWANWLKAGEYALM